MRNTESLKNKSGKYKTGRLFASSLLFLLAAVSVSTCLSGKAKSVDARALNYTVSCANVFLLSLSCNQTFFALNKFSTASASRPPQEGRLKSAGAYQPHSKLQLLANHSLVGRLVRKDAAVMKLRSPLTCEDGGVRHGKTCQRTLNGCSKMEKSDLGADDGESVVAKSKTQNPQSTLSQMTLSGTSQGLINGLFLGAFSSDSQVYLGA